MSLMTNTSCPQLPMTAPHLWAALHGAGFGNPPAAWTCAPARYYESDPAFFTGGSITCDCGCGVVDPDCGYIPASCREQTWEPKYTVITCKGQVAPVDHVFCRMESATCMQLPPGLPFYKDRPSTWTCLPDVYYELADAGSSVADCDCSCGDLDPDCMLNYNNIYCADYMDSAGTPLARTWVKGPNCVVSYKDGKRAARCEPKGRADYCPQLPLFEPEDLVAPGRGKGNPPPEWTCPPGKYYESEGSTDGKFFYSCDCGCGVIDPDCGFYLPSCDDQTWKPSYTTFTCGGQVLDKTLMYCRLESARCTALPPGIHDNLWNCIPDLYNELSDNVTSLNDCDCNCGGLDPDCLGDFEQLYCQYNDEVIAFPLTAARCDYINAQVGATCVFDLEDLRNLSGSQCPQLPVTAPALLAAAYGLSTGYGRPPEGWICAKNRYYETDPNRSDPVDNEDIRCDCGCGVIDPDCGYIPQSCSNQTWTPAYTSISCGEQLAPLDLVFCRLESAKCMPLPPGLTFNKRTPDTWTCIPDVYYELLDPGTSLDDCDCSCGDLDPDCMLLYNNVYCTDYIDDKGTPLPRSWETGPTCVVDFRSGGGAYCKPRKDEQISCPQLPPFLPKDLVAAGYGKGNPPPAWTCAPEVYFESEGSSKDSSLIYSCDCGCGLIDPDCGYVLQSCEDQTWNPSYSHFTCEGKVLDKSIMYCRLESARCFTLPPGIHDKLWKCIPDVYHELSDDLTTLNDCDCNCGSLDPDCLLDYNNLYCVQQGEVVQLGKEALCEYLSPQTGAQCVYKCPEGMVFINGPFCGNKDFHVDLCCIWNEEPIEACAAFANHTLRIGVLAEEALADSVEMTHALEATHRRWSPTFETTVKTAMERYQCKFRMVVLPRQKLIEAVSNNELELVFVDPGVYTLLAYFFQAKAIATIQRTFNGKVYSPEGGLIFRNRTSSSNSNLFTLQDVAVAAKTRALTACASESGAFESFAIQAFEFFTHGFDMKTIFSQVLYSGSHERTVQMVASGACDLGFTPMVTLPAMAASGDYSLSDFVLLNRMNLSGWEVSTSAYSSWPLVSLPHVPDDIWSALLTPLAVPRMQSSEAAALGQHTGFETAALYENEMNVMYQLNLVDPTNMACPVGSQRERNLPLTPCRLCPKGRYNTERTGKCRACSPGTFSPVPGAVLCEQCSPGFTTHTFGSTVCQENTEALVYAPIKACLKLPNQTLHVGVLLESPQDMARWRPTFETELNTYFNRYSCHFHMIGLEWDQVATAINNTHIDFIFSDPSTMVQFSLSHGLRPLSSVLRIFNGHLSAVYGGLIFRRAGRNEDINSLDDLTGKAERRKRLVVCPPSTSSFGGYLAQLYEIFKVGKADAWIGNVEWSFSHSHLSTLDMVYGGSCDVGMVRTETLEKAVINLLYEIEDFVVINPRKHDEFLLLSSTDLYPEWTFAALSHVDAELASKVSIPLLALRDWMPAAQAGYHAGFTPTFDLASVSKVRYDMAMEPNASCGPGHERALGAMPEICVPCKSGKFNPDGVGACRPCSKGHYSELEGSARCVRCRFGTNSLQEGSAGCEDYTNHLSLAAGSVSAVIGLAVTTSLLCFFFAALVVAYRDTKLMKASSFKFSLALVVSCGFICASTVLFAMEPGAGNGICALRWWLPCLLASTVLGTMFSKTYRLYTIFRVYETKQKIPSSIKFKDIRVAALVASFVLVTAVILAIYFLVDPSQYQLRMLLPDGQDFYTTWNACSISKVFVPLIFTLYTVILALMSALAYKVRKLPTIFNESQLIAWLLYNTVFLGLITLSVDFMLQDTEITAKMVVRCVALWLGSLTPVLVLFLPKLLVIWRDKQNTSAYASSNPGSNTTGGKLATNPPPNASYGGTGRPVDQSYGPNRSLHSKDPRSNVSNHESHKSHQSALGDSNMSGTSEYEGELHFVYEDDGAEVMTPDMSGQVSVFLTEKRLENGEWVAVARKDGNKDGGHSRSGSLKGSRIAVTPRQPVKNLSSHKLQRLEQGSPGSERNSTGSSTPEVRQTPESKNREFKSKSHEGTPESRTRMFNAGTPESRSRMFNAGLRGLPISVTPKSSARAISPKSNTRAVSATSAVNVTPTLNSRAVSPTNKARSSSDSGNDSAPSSNISVGGRRSSSSPAISVPAAAAVTPKGNARALSPSAVTRALSGAASAKAYISPKQKFKKIHPSGKTGGADENKVSLEILPDGPDEVPHEANPREKGPGGGSHSGSHSRDKSIPTLSSTLSNSIPTLAVDSDSPTQGGTKAVHLARRSFSTGQQVELQSLPTLVADAGEIDDVEYDSLMTGMIN